MAADPRPEQTLHTSKDPVPPLNVISFLSSADAIVDIGIAADPQNDRIVASIRIDRDEEWQTIYADLRSVGDLIDGINDTLREAIPTPKETSRSSVSNH
jgi:hypothetical protein